MKLKENTEIKAVIDESVLNVIIFCDDGAPTELWEYQTAGIEF